MGTYGVSRGQEQPEPPQPNDRVELGHAPGRSDDRPAHDGGPDQRSVRDAHVRGYHRPGRPEREGYPEQQADPKNFNPSDHCGPLDLNTQLSARGAAAYLRADGVGLKVTRRRPSLFGRKIQTNPEVTTVPLSPVPAPDDQRFATGRNPRVPGFLQCRSILPSIFPAQVANRAAFNLDAHRFAVKSVFFPSPELRTSPPEHFVGNARRRLSQGPPGNWIRRQPQSNTLPVRATPPAQRDGFVLGRLALRTTRIENPCNPPL
jgi:hypothetical protein